MCSRLEIVSVLKISLITVGGTEVYVNTTGKGQQSGDGERQTHSGLEEIVRLGRMAGSEI